MVFQWRLSDSKSPQVSGILLSALADLNNAVVWIVSIRPPSSNFSSPLSKPLETILRAPITTGITVNLMFHCSFSSQARSKYLSFCLFSLLFTLWSAWTAKSSIRQVFFIWFFLLSRVLTGIRLSVCISKSQGILCVPFSWPDSGLCMYHLVVW